MVEPNTSFREFEHRGWSAQDLTTGYHDHLSPVTRQVIGTLLEAAAVRHGARCGCCHGRRLCGGGSRARCRGGRDRLLGSQLALARQHNPGVEFRDGDAGALPFPDASFDAVISNFGMPHFPDPDAFLHEALRVLRRGGRIAFSTWAPPQECVGFGIIYGAVQARGRTDVPLPRGPDFFLFSDPDQCERSLRAAGFQSVAITKVPQVWRLSSPDRLLEAILKGTVRASALLQAQAPEALEAIRAEVREAAAAYAHEGAIALMMPAVVASAEKP
jgi:SAM-dependent methyltransferase